MTTTYANLLASVTASACDDDSYFGSAHGTEISLRRALIEVRRHDASADEMLSELGERETYSAQVILCWLGY